MTTDVGGKLDKLVTFFLQRILELLVRKYLLHLHLPVDDLIDYQIQTKRRRRMRKWMVKVHNRRDGSLFSHFTKKKYIEYRVQLCKYYPCSTTCCPETGRVLLHHVHTSDYNIHKHYYFKRSISIYNL